MNFLLEKINRFNSWVDLKSEATRLIAFLLLTTTGMISLVGGLNLKNGWLMTLATVLLLPIVISCVGRAATAGYDNSVRVILILLATVLSSAFIVAIA